MEFKELSKYKINEESVITEQDKRHIENYKQLIKFFEIELSNSVSEGKADYQALHTSCLKCIRFLDGLIFTYEASAREVKFMNNAIDRIVKDNTPMVEGEKKDIINQEK